MIMGLETVSVRIERILPVIVLAGTLLAACSSPSGPIAARATAQTLTRIEQALNEGDLTFAERKLQKLRVALPGDRSVWVLSARLYSLGNRAEELRGASEQILTIDPVNGFALEQLGQLCLTDGKLDIAEEYLTRAVTVEPLRWTAWNALGVIADLTARFEVSRRHFERALEVVPGHPKLIANLGWSRVLAGDLPAAERLLRLSLEEDPEAMVTRNNLAFSVALQGRYAEAILLYGNHFNAAVVANNVGYAALLRNDSSTARKYLQMALELMPNYYKKAANNLALVDT